MLWSVKLQLHSMRYAALAAVGLSCTAELQLHAGSQSRGALAHTIQIPSIDRRVSSICTTVGYWVCAVGVQCVDSLKVLDGAVGGTNT
jgi:hypothetical protein